MLQIKNTIERYFSQINDTNEYDFVILFNVEDSWKEIKDQLEGIEENICVVFDVKRTSSIIIKYGDKDIIIYNLELNENSIPKYVECKEKFNNSELKPKINIRVSYKENITSLSGECSKSFTINHLIFY